MSTCRPALLFVVVFAALSTTGCLGSASTDALSFIDTPPVRVAVVGADMGRRAAYQVFAEGDLSGSITHVDTSEFNDLSVEELRARYDDLLFTWVTPSMLNV